MRNGKTGNERRCETEKLKRAERAHVFLREWRVHQLNACRPSLTNDCPSCVCVCDPPVIFFLYLMHVFRNRRWIKMRKKTSQRKKRERIMDKKSTQLRITAFGDHWSTESKAWTKLSSITNVQICTRTLQKLTYYMSTHISNMDDTRKKNSN